MLLVEEQAGFRRNVSTSNTFTIFVQDGKLDFNCQESMATVFINFKGTYDTVWRAKLINKLKNMWSERMLRWYTRFLTQRWAKTLQKYAELI